MFARQAGSYGERPARGRLETHFSSVWTNRLSHSGGKAFLVIPDGTIDLQWVDGRWRVAGPDRQPIIEQLPADAVVVGFRFHPASARGWLGAPAFELCGRRVWLEELGVSERTLRRRFDAEFGYGPKTLHRILRFKNYLDSGRRPESGGRQAAAAGYADQSHLVRDCRRLALCTPSELPACTPATSVEET